MLRPAVSSPIEHKAVQRAYVMCQFGDASVVVSKGENPWPDTKALHTLD